MRQHDNRTAAIKSEDVSSVQKWSSNKGFKSRDQDRMGPWLSVRPRKDVAQTYIRIDLLQRSFISAKWPANTYDAVLRLAPDANDTSVVDDGKSTNCTTQHGAKCARPQLVSMTRLATTNTDSGEQDGHLTLSDHKEAYSH